MQAIKKAEKRASTASANRIRKRLGAMKTAKALFKFGRLRMAGEPFKSLPPPEDWNEELTRRQAAPAVLLYRSLLDVMPENEALDLTRDCVVEGALAFLKLVIPPLQRSELAPLTESEQVARLEEMTGCFFNAEMEGFELDAGERFRFRIKRCRFVELMRAIGEEKLAPLFCAGDGLFFDRNQPEVQFDRPVTLASDGEPCDFRFTWKRPAS